MIQHYVGIKDGKRIYTYHKIPFEMHEGLQVNASKSMQVLCHNNRLISETLVRSPGFEPGIASLEGLCPNQLDDDRSSFRH